MAARIDNFVGSHRFTDSTKSVAEVTLTRELPNEGYGLFAGDTVEWLNVEWTVWKVERDGKSLTLVRA